MAFDPNQPFDLPDLPPPVELETRAVLKQAVGARAALAELKGACGRVPDPGILVSLVTLLEAKASSEIENIVTTNDELFRATGPDDPAASAAAREVLRYRDALWRGHRQLAERPLGTNLFVDVCRAIRGVQVDIRNLPGTRIVRGDGRVVYAPPEGVALIRAKLANLERFIHADDRLDPLVRLAVMHYQFEAIHPFTDGNGRTGRVVNVLFLVEQGLLELPILYLSGYIVAHKATYYQGLRGVTERQEWESWVLYMLQAVEATATETLRRIEAICAQMQRVERVVRDSSLQVGAKDLVDHLFRQPYCRTTDIMRDLQVSRPTAFHYLQTLTGLGVLKQVRAGRERPYVNLPLLQVLLPPAADLP